MFSGGGRGNRRSGRDGPVAIPRGEKVQLKKFSSSISGGGSDTINNSTNTENNIDNNDNNDSVALPSNQYQQLQHQLQQRQHQQELAAAAAASMVPSASVAAITSTASMVNPALAVVDPAARVPPVHTDESVSALLRLAKASTALGSTEKQPQQPRKKRKKEQSSSSLKKKVALPPPEESSDSENWYGQTLEYAAGQALRLQVLEPVCKALEQTSPNTELSRLLSLYSRGQLLLLKQNDQITYATIQRITSDDGRTLGLWWEADKFLSYTSEEWSKWWTHRCFLFDPGCEMVQLLSASGTTLGVAYYERNLIDKRTSDGTRITLIRGIRLNPIVNLEALRRSDYLGNRTNLSAPCRGVASLLISHILFSSLRYGTHTVATNCPKNEVAEEFYERFMGKPVDMDIDTGRRYYRMAPQRRFHELQKAFRKQAELLNQLSREKTSATKEFEASANNNNNNSSSISNDNHNSGAPIDTTSAAPVANGGLVPAKLPVQHSVHNVQPLKKRKFENRREEIADERPLRTGEVLESNQKDEDAGEKPETADEEALLADEKMDDDEDDDDGGSHKEEPEEEEEEEGDGMEEDDLQEEKIGEAAATEEDQEHAGHAEDDNELPNKSKSSKQSPSPSQEPDIPEEVKNSIKTEEEDKTGEDDAVPGTSLPRKEDDGNHKIMPSGHIQRSVNVKVDHSDTAVEREIGEPLAELPGTSNRSL